MADTVTVAKRDLRAGEVLDGGGGYTVNGVIETAEAARAEGLLPLGLSSGATLKTGVAAGEVVRYAEVDLEEGFLPALRREQDRLTA